MSLDPPTPLQWRTLQECVVVHRNELLRQERDGEEPSETTTATIGAAPIVAFIDDTTATSFVKSQYNNRSHDGRYATLAAVVGIRPATTTPNDTDERATGPQDDSEASFMEYMNLSNPRDDRDTDDRSKIVPLDSSVRLVGIGRAKILDYFYRVPTTLLPPTQLHPSTTAPPTAEDDDDIDDDIDNAGYDDNTPIVMAEFAPLVDDASLYAANDPNRVGEKGAKSHRTSPVHAMAKLDKVCHNVDRMHASRRRLVAGLKAARARLEMRDRRNRGEFDDVEDHDGLGSLFAGRSPLGGNGDEDVTDDDAEMSVGEFIATFEGGRRSEPNQPSPSSEVALLENYGLNYYAAFSNLPELTPVAAASIEPYYSETFRERDEYVFEVASFVAWRALEGYAREEDLAWALQSVSSVERLQRAYDVMFEHRMRLEELAREVSAELAECGEECTDLW